jgi:hypothetical protein
MTAQMFMRGKNPDAAYAEMLGHIDQTIDRVTRDRANS